MSNLTTLNLFSVRGFVAVVTGGSSGLGLMICRGLIANGAKVYVVALASDPIDEVVKKLNEIGNQYGGTAFGYSSYDYQH
ncbi:hypothetical protein NW762_011036 [Fusarium torreyae]|uniref:Uncharacterized protein n=1 Tax=Fusarium torreyae TaxID=1237075 RepID=A0A9W8RTB7_9HYPO|nr:hypothetical protein NW762_011036 [Fusarium torreyae]